MSTTTPMIQKYQSQNDNNTSFKFKQEQNDYFVASFEPDFSLLSNEDINNANTAKNTLSKFNKFKNVDPIPFSFNKTNINNNNNNNFAIFGSELKRDNSQRSFSLDLTNHNTDPLAPLSGFNQSLVYDDILNPSFTNNTGSNSNVNYNNSDKTSLIESSESTGDDENNSPVFSPRSFVSRPSSISSSSINEIVDAVVKSRNGKRERTRRVRKVKASHNDIEKKYRLSINDKIVQLRDLVPTIRYGYKEISKIPLEQNDVDTLDGLQPTRKMNKGTILNKTIEYIKHLEAKCQNYKSLNDDLISKISNDKSLALMGTDSTSSSASSVISSTVVTPTTVKLENQLPIIPSQQKFNLNILQNMNDQIRLNKEDEPFSPLDKVFIDNNNNNNNNNMNAENVSNNLFKLDNFS